MKIYQIMIEKKWIKFVLSEVHPNQNWAGFEGYLKIMNPFWRKKYDYHEANCLISSEITLKFHV